ncbi:MAG TPA: HDOD domain-containing protein [Verrucomicrobiae bacterium]|nr:HDOD domain-containing protein [Verrucomicrobiae bacterium]
MDAAERYLDRVQHLPPARSILARMAVLMSDPNRDMDNVAELISYDPALTAEVLKRSNSAFFRGSEHARDASEAVSRLGFNEVQHVVSTLSGSHTPIQPLSETLDPDNLWRHSLRTAVTAAALSSITHESETAAFTAGLLHDVGKLVFGSLEPSVYAKLLAESAASGTTISHVEAATWGLTHAELGSRLLSRWGLPPNITLVIFSHHSSPMEAAPFECLAAMIQVSNRWAKRTMEQRMIPVAPSFLTSEEHGLLGIEFAEIQSAFDQGSERLHQIGNVLDTSL